MAFPYSHKAWIYEYLPITQPQQKNQSTLLPRACRWNFGGATRGQRKKVMEWRKVFEQLQFSEASPKLPTYKCVPIFQLLCHIYYPNYVFRSIGTLTRA